MRCRAYLPAPGVSGGGGCVTPGDAFCTIAFAWFAKLLPELFEFELEVLEDGLASEVELLFDELEPVDPVVDPLDVPLEDPPEVLPPLEPDELPSPEVDCEFSCGVSVFFSSVFVSSFFSVSVVVVVEPVVVEELDPVDVNVVVDAATTAACACCVINAEVSTLIGCVDVMVGADASVT